MSIVWRDKVLSSYNGNIESVLIVNDVEATGEELKEVEAPNGMFVKLGDLAGMGREVKLAELGAEEDGEALLVSSPEVLYHSGDELDDFVNEAGKVARAFRLAEGDVISLTADLITGTPTGKIGQVFVVGKDGKLVADAEATTGLRFLVREDAGNELTRKQKAWRFDIVK